MVCPIQGTLSLLCVPREDLPEIYCVSVEDHQTMLRAMGWYGFKLDLT